MKQKDFQNWFTSFFLSEKQSQAGHRECFWLRGVTDPLIFDLLESENCLFFNSRESTELAGDKLKTIEKFSGTIIKTPEVFSLSETVDNYPVIFKPRYGKMGEGIHIIHNGDEFKNILESVTQKGLDIKDFVIQECITDSLGKDIRILFCNGKITLLPDCWNYQWHNHNEKRMLMLKQAEYDRIAKDPSILHFTTRKKAWNTPNWELAERFWYYAAHTAFFNEIISANTEAVKAAKYDVRSVPDWKKAGALADVTREKLDQLQAVYDEEVERLAGKIKRCEADLSAIRNSVSFKVGRAVTWVPRKTRSALRCLKHNGFIYTVIRIFCGKNKAEAYKKSK